MLKSLIEGKNLKKTLDEIVAEFHLSGPTNALSMERLAYIKKYHPNIFQEYESKIIGLMGLFYKAPISSSLIEEVYSIFASSISDDTGHWFSPIQASAFKSIRDNKYFSFSAPTSSGKSHLFRVLLEEAKGDVVIVVPSRALIAEYYYKILELMEHDNEVLVLQFIDNVNTSKVSRRIFIITPERGVELFKRTNEFNIELFLLDEAQISEDEKRGLRFDSFVRRIHNQFPLAKKVFAHPFVSNPDAQLKKHSITQNAKAKNYEQHSVGKIFLSYQDNKFKYFSPNEICAKVECPNDPIIEILKAKGSLLVYTSKKKIYEGQYLIDFETYISNCRKVTDKKALKIIERIKDFIGAGDASAGKHSVLIEMMKKGIVIHHGSIPLRGRLLIEEFVRMGAARICFATSTLNQGINMPFDAVWIDSFFNLPTLDLKNLIGRAGRTRKQSDSLDYGYTVVKTENEATFSTRFKETFEISEISALDSDIQNLDEDDKDNVEAIRNHSFNDNLHLPQSQVDRISTADLDEDIKYILDNLLENGIPIQGNKYIALKESVRDKIKTSIKNIYMQHLRRKDLTVAEKSVLSTAIPILLWSIQGKSFSEVVSLRHAFLSKKNERRKLLTQVKKGEISAKDAKDNLNELKVRISQAPSTIPDKNLRRISSFHNTMVKDLDFDLVVYDTYDYLDKVISLSLIDPICAAFELFFERTQDSRAKSFVNYVRYGTNDSTEILLMRYGFGFEEIEWLKEYISDIDTSKITFKKTVNELPVEKMSLIKRYL